MKAWIALLLISCPAFAAAPANGLRCTGHGADNQRALEAFLHERVITQAYFPTQGGFDFQQGALLLRTKNALARFCVDGLTAPDAVCAPWGNAARVRYSRRAGMTGLGLIEAVDPSLSAYRGDILLDCREL